MNSSANKHTLHVSGMHCPSCELLIEKELGKLEGISHVQASLSKAEVSFECDTEPDLAALNKPIKAHGYNLSREKTSTSKTPSVQLLLPFLVAFAIFALFLLLQKTGLINLVNPEKMSLPFVFLIGIVASLSTCMAVVGGLVLSISSSYAQGHHVQPMLRFHLSRLISFFILGGVVGLLGSAFLLTPTITFILNSLLFLIMLIMGLNLLDIFHFTKVLQLKLPKSWGHAITTIKHENRIITPILLGAATFFLPCGFTQSMQVFALSSGDWLQGALIMLIFALGTFPVLGLISFASVTISSGDNSRLFFRTAGFLIIFFAILNIAAAFAAIGLTPPLGF